MLQISNLKTTIRQKPQAETNTRRSISSARRYKQLSNMHMLLRSPSPALTGASKKEEEKSMQFQVSTCET